MKRERILVIEDEADIVDLLRYNLKKEGFEVDAASDGERGLDLARSKTYDLVAARPHAARHRRARGLPAAPRRRADRARPDHHGHEQERGDRRARRALARRRRLRDQAVLGQGAAGAREGRAPALAAGRAVPADKRPVARAGIEVDPVRHTVSVDGEPARSRWPSSGCCTS